MKCPGCGTAVEDGAAICPQCDYILDTSFLDASPPVGDGDGDGDGQPAAADRTMPRAKMPAPPPGRAPTGARKAVASGARPPTGARPAVAGGKAPTRSRATAGAHVDTPPRGTRAGAGSGSAASAAAKPKMKAMPEAPGREIKEERKKVDYQALAQEYQQEPGPKREAFKVQKMTSADEAYGEVRNFMSNLAGSDRLAVVGLAFVVLCSFFPWKITAAEGDVLGLLSLGVVATVGAAAAIGALYVRVQRVLPQLNPVVPWFAQLGATAFVILWCLIYIKISWNGTMVQALDGNLEQAISKPDIGVYLALCGGLIGLGGTLMGLKEQQPQ